MKDGSDIHYEQSTTIVLCSYGSDACVGNITVPQPDETNWDFYGIDWTGPVPADSETTTTIVEVPDTNFLVTEEMRYQLNERLTEINNDRGNDLVEEYYVTRDCIRQLVTN